MSYSITNNIMYVRDDAGNLVPVSMIASGADQTIQAIKDTVVAAESQIDTKVTDANAAIVAKTDEQVARIPEVTKLADDVSGLKDNKLDKTGTAVDSDKLGGKLPEHYATAQSVNQLKDDVAAITPDDSAVDGKPWTSKKIVDTLCLPLEASGNPVQCYPVAGYPLNVVSRIDAVQEGSGDPSPDNVRPIVGWDSVKVNRCGKNLFNKGDVSFKKYIEISTNYPAGDYVLSAETEVEAEHNTVQIGYCVDGLWKYIMKNIDNRWNHKINASIGITGFRFYADISPANNVNCVYKNIQLELGSTATAYEPYTGDTYIAALPETVYGGKLDWNTGVLTVTHVKTKFNPTMNTNTLASWTNCVSVYNEFKRLMPAGREQRKYMLDKITVIDWDSAEKTTPTAWYANLSYGVIFPYKTLGVNSTSTKAEILAAAKAYFDELNATMVYELYTPYTIQLTPQQIAALYGVNTLYTDSGDTSVSGRTDMIWLTQSLIDRIAALETAAVSE